MKITVNASAKINLLLDILSRLENGYHSLFMIMQSVDLCDTVSVERTEGNEIKITCTNSDIPCDEKNIAYKAAKKFYEYNNIDDCGTLIHIVKRIPHSAGLAGGSADGAAVIYALNKLCCTDLSSFELCRLGASVGADVPFCLTGGTMLAQNIGDVLSPLPQLPDWTFVVVKPDCFVSSGEAYSDFDIIRGLTHPEDIKVLSLAASGDYESAYKKFGNVFEQFVEVPDRVRIKSVMRMHGSKCCQMSGSGPSVFGIFDNHNDAEECADEIRSFIKDVFVCSPTGKSISKI